MPSHLDAHASPRHTPAASRSHRTPSRGGAACGPPAAPAAMAASAYRPRARSRSITSSANAASTQNMTKMSSSAVRDITNSSPSSASSSPATHPSSVDRVIRRAVRARIKIAKDPATATANRHPNGVSPNTHSPPAIKILPERGVDHELPAGREDAAVAAGDQRVPARDVVVLHPEPQNPQRVRHVIGLIEDHRMRDAEPAEPHERAQRGHQQRPQPPPQPAARHRRHQPVTQGSGPRAVIDPRGHGP